MRVVGVIVVGGVLAALACESGSSSGANGRKCTEECFAAIECRKGSCAGPVVSTGCCTCLADEVEATSCVADAGAD